ncbi:molybdopterin dinucleotide binding domain-containing protein [Eggerthella sinensis]|uniref:molybdopterin dinucleotide binding domain-containing protein n=1 Tax=Eggerthella sinensis TaxID=242230 RepID=UPI001D08EE3F|nr:molybdopterin dinucleotide binding domain-containing protein [Eggerthella sinensis]MCB7037352.1 molybdopterin-dependent oxidoreductase [Eggerthella sinensis]
MHASDTRPLTLDRRRFLQVTAGAGVAAAAGLGLAGCAGKPREREPEAAPEPRRGNPVEAIVDPSTGSVEVNEDVIVRYSACLGCYSSCGNRVHIDRATGKMFGVGGNPYNPNNAYPYLDHTEPLESAYRSMSLAAGGQNVHGALCGRGNGTWDAYRQPDRITVPLKRAGKRGEGKWKPIGWDQLIEELCEGGKLFADLGEDREIEGFRALHDTSTPLDPDAPELGPVANQLVMLGSRGDGRSGVGSRFSSAFGTKNNIGHGATCGGSENAGFYAIEESYRALCADFTESEYVICCGMFPGANGKSMQGIAHWASAALAAGTAKIDIVDPALGNGVATTAMENVRWLPITSATNAAFGMALIRIIIESGTYNETALSFPSQEAAVAGGYAAFSNASYLVVEDEGHERYRMFLRAEDAGMETPAPAVDDDKKKDYFVVIDASAAQPALHTACQQAAIDYEGEVNGVRVRSAFSLLKESVLERTVEEYAAICGVPVEELERMAAEFTSHGTKAAFCGLFGGSAQANGSDATFIYPIMNALIGSNNMRGGMVPRRESGDAFGDKTRYRLSTIKDQPKASGASIARTGVAWEDTSEYKRRAATEENPRPKLPWYPVTGSADNQAICSIANAYPYQAKITFTWMATPLQASSGALRAPIMDALKDVDVVPLAVTCDVVMGESAQLSDYVIPDTTPYESWGVRTQEGYWNGKGNTVRWQAVEPETMVLPDGRHASYEAFLCDMAKRLELPGFGDNAIESADGTPFAFNDASDYFLKAVANLAYSGNDPVPDIAEDEAHVQGLDELPASWKQAVTEEEWPKVLQVLSRGGRFWPLADAYDDQGRSAYAASYQTCFYSESKGSAKNLYTGDYESGVLHWQPETCADRTLLRDLYPKEEWPFASTNYKPKFRSISMLANSPVMQQIASENFVEMNADDAASLGIANGDDVEVENPTGDVMRAPALVRGGIASGTFAVAYGYGHVAYGAQDMEIDGEKRPGNPAIAAGIHLQTMLDPQVEGVLPLSDPEAATPGRSGGAYRIKKASGGTL